jgi:hypothetical protein
VRLPIVTVCIIVANFAVFALELAGGDAVVLNDRQPATTAA